MTSEWTKIYIILLILLTGVLLYLLAPILTPFLVGAILAYLANPTVENLMRFRLPRLVGVIIVFFLIFFVIGLLVLLLIPLIQKQTETLANFIPRIIPWIQNSVLPWLIAHFGVHEWMDIDYLKSSLAENASKGSSVFSWLLQATFHSGVRIIEWITNLILIPVVFFYFLVDWNRMLHGLRKLIPRKIEPTLVKLIRECDEVLSAFFRGQLLVMISLGIVYASGLTLIGLQVGLVLGIISGILCIVPYLGFSVGIVTASIAAYLQFGNMVHVLLVWLVFGIGQVLESTLLTPNLVGHRIGLHPVAVIFAVLSGGSLFGFFGVLLALPVAAVVMVWLRFLSQQYRSSQLYDAKKK